MVNKNQVVLAEMSYRILLPDKTDRSGSGAGSTPSENAAAAVDNPSPQSEKAVCMDLPTTPGVASLPSSSAPTATEEATAAPCAGVWGGTPEVRVDFAAVVSMPCSSFGALEEGRGGGGWGG